MRREEQVTVQGPVQKQQPDGMSHGGAPPPLMRPCPSLRMCRRAKPSLPCYSVSGKPTAGHPLRCMCTGVVGSGGLQVVCRWVAVRQAGHRPWLNILGFGIEQPQCLPEGGGGYVLRIFFWGGVGRGVHVGMAGNRAEGGELLPGVTGKSGTRHQQPLARHRRSDAPIPGERGLEALLPQNMGHTAMRCTGSQSLPLMCRCGIAQAVVPSVNIALHVVSGCFSAR